MCANTGFIVLRASGFCFLVFVGGCSNGKWQWDNGFADFAWGRPFGRGMCHRGTLYSGSLPYIHPPIQLYKKVFQPLALLAIPQPQPLQANNTEPSKHRKKIPNTKLNPKIF